MTKNQMRLWTSLNKLRDYASKTPIWSEIREIENEIKLSIRWILEENNHLNNVIETLINESDEGVDYI